MNDKIILGSGYLYLAEYTNNTIPEDSVIETDDNRAGYISGGATLTYGATFYEAKDDMGHKSKSVLQEETATLGAGICTFDGEKIKKLVSTARVTSSSGKRTVKIGGIGNYDGKKYLVRFVHPDLEQGDIRVTLVGTNQAGLTMSFQKSQETILNPEFHGKPMDSDGTLIQIDETIPTT